jgi:regulator of nonsense transcripts 1
MANKPFQLHQTVFKQSHPPIHVNPIHEHDLNQDIVNAFLDTTGADGMIGVAPAYSKCVLALIAISTSSQVLLVRLPKASNKAKKRKNKLLTEGRRLLRDAFFCNPQHPIAAFRMDRLAVALYLDLALRVTGGVDLLSTGQAERGSLEAIMTTLGGVTNIQKEVVAGLFKHREDISAPERDIALQAWTACKAAGLPRTATSLAKISQIDTQALDETVLLSIMSFFGFSSVLPAPSCLSENSSRRGPLRRSQARPGQE